MPWHPPIPKGAFVEARALGTGLVLLGYCYDIVRDGGMIELNLHELCAALDTSYSSIRRWWGQMQQMGIIVQAEERGRRGVRAYFNRDWIDWRYPEMRSESSSLVSAFQETSSLVSANTAEMRSESSSLVSAIGSAYKVLMIDHESESPGGSEDRDGTAHTHPPAIALLLEIFPDATISREQGDDVCSTVGDLAFWRQKLLTWRANGYKPRIGNLLDSYRKDQAKESRNGTHQPKRHANAPNRRSGRTPERLDGG